MSESEYTQRATISWAVVGTYLFLMLMLYLLTLWVHLSVYAAIGLIAILVLYLVRFLTMSYTIGEETLRATRIFGSRVVPLDTVRKVDLSSLRDLAPVGWSGTWGWRSRMWSPVIGHFDNISSVHLGLTVYGDGVPFFISPKDREAFLSELDKRCGNRLLTK
jgi:Ca2+/Na+ antiporter